jgi:hypothetical protein
MLLKPKIDILLFLIGMSCLYYCQIAIAEHVAVLMIVVFLILLGIVQYDADEKRVISAMWAKDEDISRFLRYLLIVLIIVTNEGL